MEPLKCCIFHYPWTIISVVFIDTYYDVYVSRDSSDSVKQFQVAYHFTTQYVSKKNQGWARSGLSKKISGTCRIFCRIYGKYIYDLQQQISFRSAPPKSYSTINCETDQKYFSFKIRFHTRHAVCRIRLSGSHRKFGVLCRIIR